MNTHLLSSFEQLEKQREEFSQWVAQAPEAAQHLKPAADQWSAAQLLYHLSRVDQQVVLGLEKRLASGKPLRPRRLGTQIRSFLLNLFLSLPIKFKAPAAVSEVPEQVIIPEVIQHWKQTREKLQAILSGFPDQHLNKEVFFHPRSGMITLPQTLRFMIEHIEHHRRQMRRLLS
ncbi:DinB family protein [Rufibacter latericius]|uniref:DinB family protein n=1 Tax=Rufibacter latericius TaxID=2487040 RepID=A0A3M9MA78_9BACT|nr:DinB family protein [Rufibacter latericius]RNI22471.1 DinB family protein [Rufibacter latericius]